MGKGRRQAAPLTNPMTRFPIWLLALGLAFVPSLTQAQQSVKLCIPGTFPSCQDVTSLNPLPVTSSGGLSSNATIVAPLGSNPAASAVSIAFPSDQVLGITGTVTASGTVSLGAGTAGIGSLTAGTAAIGSLTAGTAVIGHVIVDTASTTAVTQATAGNLNATVVGTGTFSTQAQPTPVTSGGLSTCYLQATASTNATSCKAGAGQIYGYKVTNTGSGPQFVRFYNLATAPTCSSATGIVEGFAVPGTAGSTGAGITQSMDMGVAYGTGIAFCLTGAIGSTDATNAVASTTQITIYYK